MTTRVEAECELYLLDKRRPLTLLALALGAVFSSRVLVGIATKGRFCPFELTIGVYGMLKGTSDVLAKRQQINTSV
jgi:hypothetical protein